MARRSGDGGAAELAAATVWISATVEAEQLPGVSRSETLTDWRIIVAPPLVLDNQLPLRGSFLVWERPKVTSLAKTVLHSVCMETSLFCFFLLA